MRVPFPPLRYSIPAVLFFVGLMLGAISTVYEIKVVFRRLEEVMQRHVGFIGSQTAGIASFMLEQTEPEGLSKQIAQLGADQTLQVAMVLDDQGKVLFSSRLEYRHKSFTSTPWAYAAPYLTNSTGQTTYLVQNRSRLIGVFPFALPTSEDELVSSNKGIVFVEYDLSHPKRLTIQNLVTRTGYVLAALGFFCILTWWIFHKVITERIAQLVNATKEIANGNLHKRAPLHGSDELSELSNAFDKMAAEINRRTDDLKIANDQMKREIEDRKAAEEALRRSEILFRSVWENSGNGMRLTDQSGTIRAVNRAYCELVGATESQLVNQPFIISYSDSPEIQQMFQRYLNKFDSGAINSGAEKRVIFSSGKVAYLSINNTYIEVPSGESFLLSSLDNVTEKVEAFQNLKHAKEFSENLIETANVLIIGITHSGTIHIFNEAAEKLSGYSRTEIKGKNLFDTLVPRSHFEGAEKLFVPPSNGRSINSFEHKIITRSAEHRVISWQTNTVVGVDGLSGTICFGIDVTERIRQEEERLDFERKLLDTQRLESLGVLAGGIAHDFNNLLTTILGNASLAAMHLPDDDTPMKTNLEHVEKACIRAADLCKQMLAYSGRGRVVTEQVNLNNLISDLSGLLDISISKKVTLALSLDESLPQVEGDKSQFHQVIMNLIINASEAMGEKSGIIQVRTGVMELTREFLEGAFLAPENLGGSYVFVSVTDTGCGMSPETRARIFDPFFTTKFTGRGLGLAAVLGIVRGHKGILKVESELGKGSTFTILFPARESKQPPSVHSKPLQRRPSNRGGVILVVDDEQHIVRVIEEALRRDGFEIAIARDGMEAVQIFEGGSSGISAVILDLTMPVMSGAEAFKLMKDVAPEIPIILMSGYHEQEINERFSEQKPEGFLQKPFDAPAILQVVYQALEGCEPLALLEDQVVT